MSAIRRVASERATRLSAKSSPYHAAVALFDAQDTPGPSTMRRQARRVKRENVELNDQEGSDDALPAAVKKRKGKVVKTATSVATTETKSRSPKKPKAIPQGLDVPHPAPERWKEA
ncbi:hypothetical protein BKA82DRAFT_25376 [Pisolithus tinctorius]|uniref:Uncharacterized protein n=1 Tax=Pisolithus tinctorius Marx 270 TaxID=870435 RepID=A0A0C3J9F5_PISTI|nr:hypothetical protein BKA82DRAFT_25376 [Pisolithus tinctorius]KIO05678.1 hypothetical protein M404DRAFT_25376 [Pisolithus tinctorius Marx 270]